MHCYICDGQLAPDEIKHTPEFGRGDFAPCGKCQQVADELFEPLDEEEVEKQLSLELFYEDIMVLEDCESLDDFSLDSLT